MRVVSVSYENIEVLDFHLELRIRFYTKLKKMKSQTKEAKRVHFLT